MREPCRLAIVCASLVAAFATIPAMADRWPEFRGPTGQGKADVAQLPLEWDAAKNVVWKRAIPGSGWSSPVVVDGHVYLTAAVPVEQERGDYTLNALCLDAKTGEIRWNRPVFYQPAETDERIHTKNSHASPTPLVDRGQLFVHFGHQGTARLELDGNIAWKRVVVEYDPVHGNGGSPALWRRALFFSCDGLEKQLVVAVDRDSGALLWEQSRDTDVPKKFSFSTPLVIDVDGQSQLISPGSGAVCAYDLQSGKELWRVRYDGYSVIPRPVSDQGLVFISTGYDRPQVLAIRPTGKGDVTETHVAWRLQRGAPHTPSLLLVADGLFMISDRGIATCVDAKTGTVHWQQRVGGKYSASPLYAAGRIYLQSESGVGTVLSAGKEFRELAKNDLGERTLASYAVADGAIFIRSAENLYRIEN